MNLIFGIFFAAALVVSAGPEAAKVAMQRHFVEDWASAAGTPLTIETVDLRYSFHSHGPGDHLYKVKVRTPDGGETYIWFFFGVQGDDIRVEKEIDFDHTTI